MLPDRAARAFPLLLLGLMAGLAYWLDFITELPQFAPGPVRQSPDLVARKVTSTAFGQDGRPLYRLAAAEMRRFPGGQNAEFDQPRLVRTLPGTPELTVVGDTAQVTEAGDKVWFEGGVTVTRAPFEGRPAVVIRASRVEFDAVTGAARSEAPVDADAGTSRMRGNGFEYDHERAVLKVHRQGRIEYDPPKKR
ncbi:LPS export ABC transporter periplasmic protein LptC [Chitinimonas lacunae]|uniref:LPS export ABC transporter periplasmic protein LptC n=1 Tax=Chitinimonas lacunae TaxID=1963018 RepID=A0ABV8MS12_9NEIS